MFRPFTLAAVLAVMLAGCAPDPVRPPPPAAPPPSAGAGAIPAVPKATPPAAARPQGDASPLLGGESDGAANIISCRQRCDGSFNSCMDSVASRPSSDSLSGRDTWRPFTPTNNCQAQLQRCFDRCRP